MELDAVAGMLHGTLIDFYKLHIDGRPAESQPEAHPSFLLGIRYKDEFRLYQTVGAPPVAQVDQWTCVGWGSTLGQYIADLLYKPGLGVASVERLAAYLVYQAKRHSSLLWWRDKHCVADAAGRETNDLVR